MHSPRPQPLLLPVDRSKEFWVSHIFPESSYTWYMKHVKRSLKLSKYIYPILYNVEFNPFPNKPLFLGVCSTSLLKTLWEKEKLLLKSNFSFSRSVFYCFENFLPFSSIQKFSSANSFSFGSLKVTNFSKTLLKYSLAIKDVHLLFWSWLNKFLKSYGSLMHLSVFKSAQVTGGRYSVGRSNFFAKSWGRTYSPALVIALVCFCTCMKWIFEFFSNFLPVQNIVILGFFYCFFNSPEHNMLKGSF